MNLSKYELINILQIRSNKLSEYCQQSKYRHAILDNKQLQQMVDNINEAWAEIKELNK